MSYRYVLAPTAAVVAALFIGCGGQEDRTVSATSLTEAAYTKRANVICAQGRLRALRYQPSPAGEQTGEEASKAIENSVLPAIQEVVDELYELGAPSDQKGQIEAFLAAFQRGVDESEDLEVPTFDRLSRVLAPSGERARQAGLQDCIYGSKQGA
jgi:hypothetical protein